MRRVLCVFMVVLPVPVTIEHWRWAPTRSSSAQRARLLISQVTSVRIIMPAGCETFHLSPVSAQWWQSTIYWDPLSSYIGWAILLELKKLNVIILAIIGGRPRKLNKINIIIHTLLIRYLMLWVWRCNKKLTRCPSAPSVHYITWNCQTATPYLTHYCCRTANPSQHITHNNRLSSAPANFINTNLPSYQRCWLY